MFVLLLGKVFQMIFDSIFKPEYFFQPRHALQRLICCQRSQKDEFIDVRLPWGMPIRVRPSEVQGKILLTLGVIDLAVTEVLWRLAEPGEVAVDVGANIGYMTAVLAARVGSIPGGAIWAFEPHPEIFKELEFNVSRWRTKFDKIHFIIQQIALSDVSQTAVLIEPDSFSLNRGLAFMSKKDDKHTYERIKNTIEVKSLRLDDFSPEKEEIGVLKIDVEGHEVEVLKGAQRLFEEGKIRDCVFEEHSAYPTAATCFLEKKGYKIFRIHRKFWKPLLLSTDSEVPRIKWLPTSFVATRQPNRLIKRLKGIGWQSLSYFRID